MEPSTAGPEPKLLYRRLDSLFGALDPGDGSSDLVDAFFDHFYRVFQGDLRLVGARLYTERYDGFELQRKLGLAGPAAGETLDRTQDFLAYLFRHRTYLFPLATEPDSPQAAGLLPAGPAAGIVIGERPERHLLLFGLGEGWVREEVDFALNTVRSALGSRIMAGHVHVTVREAATIQRSLLLEEAPEFPGYDLACRSVPADVVGGDFFDFMPFEGGDILGLAVGDASGHGLPAALLVRDVVTGLRMGIEKEMKMSYVFRKLNRVIHQSRLTSRFISVFYGELERNGNLIFINAGHEFPLLFLKDRVVELKTGGTVIGPLPEVSFKRGFAHLDKGATLLLFSDGLLERRSPSGEYFGRERLETLVRDHPKANAAELLDAVFDGVVAFGDGAPWEDDATAVVVKRDAPAPA